MSLAKYLKKLAADGGAHKALADDMNQVMRLGVFKNLDHSMPGGSPMARQMAEEMDPINAIEKSFVNGAIFDKHGDKIKSRTYKQLGDQLGRHKADLEMYDWWTKEGQPSLADVSMLYREGLDKGKPDAEVGALVKWLSGRVNK